MTITRTTLLDLPIITTGTESGVWGDITNKGLTQYLDIAIAGMTSLTSADFTAGALTIETTEGDASSTNITSTSAQYAGFRVSSLATNSTITVGNTGSAVGRSYRIINADSTYTLTFKATGQTGVTFQPGTSGLIAFNGTDYVLIGMVGPATATDNAVVRFDGTSGRVVQNSAVTIADTTGDITTSGYVITAAGAAGTAAYTTSGDLNTGMFFPAADTLAFTEGGTEVMRIDSSSNVGIGTTSAGSKLDVKGTLRLSGSSSGYVGLAPAAAAGSTTYTLPSADGTSGQFLSTNGGGVLSWATASGGGGGGGTSVTVTQITATASQTTFNVTYTVGQISVYLNGALLASADYTATNGTTVVLATGAAANDIFTAVVYSSVTQIIQGDTSVTVSDSGSNGTITFTTDGSERGRFNSSGYLLLGTTTSSANYGIPLLQLDNSSGPEFSLRRAATADGSTVGFMTGYSTHGLIGLMSFITDGAQTASSTPGALRFMTQASGATGSPSERMRITAAGSVGIGRSSYTSMTTNGAWFDIGVFTHMSNTSNTNATLFLNQNGTGAMQEWRLANDVKGTFNQYGLGLGTAVPSSGIGICFPGTQSASSNGNTLDDYEEGTWTPSLGGNTTYNDRSGTYTKIGRLVYVAGIVSVNSIGTGSTSIISGLPFESTSGFSAGSVTYYSGISSSAYNNPVPILESGTATTFGFSWNTAGATTVSQFRVAIFQNSARIDFGFVYIAA